MNGTPLKEETARDRVLIIGSEANWEENLEPVLETAGFRVARVPGSPETLVRLDVLKPDMVILDEDVTNSMDVCYQYATARIPVIMVGDNPSQEIWRVALEESGAECYLRRPIEHEVLIARVKAILRRYKRRRRCQKNSGT